MVAKQIYKEFYLTDYERFVKALRFFANAILSESELDIVEEFLQNSKNLSEKDKLLIPKVMKVCRRKAHISGDFLVALDADEILQLYEKISSMKFNNKYKNQVQEIIDEIGIDNLYEIINELDGKSEKI